MIKTGCVNAGTRRRNSMLKKSVLVVVVVVLFLTIPVTSFASDENEGPSPYWLIPFATVLLSIAVIQFITKRRWDMNVAVGLGLLVIGYYMSENPQRMTETGLEYFSFLSLIGSLFVVSGGIYINVPSGRATPLTNVGLLAIGAVVANIVGTTGASMMLIRPYLQLNKGRVRPYHIAFFIFVVSNIGGAVTPVGDPPLLMGYLQGIPFFWISGRVLPIWFMTVGIVLVEFFIIDLLHFQKLPKGQEAITKAEAEPGQKTGGLLNVIFICVILGAVFWTTPWREVVMIGSAAGSWVYTRLMEPWIHQNNKFSFAPITEVAILFFGIFATMVPALEWLETNAASLGIQTAGQFFWATGSLSAVLDNTPTYLNFLYTAMGLLVNPETIAQVQAVLNNPELLLASSQNVQTLVAGINQYFPGQVLSADQMQVAYLMILWPKFLVAISIGAVFCGAITYIGNGPNLMIWAFVKEHELPCPSFFGYIFKYSLLYLIPVFVLVWLVMFVL
ncbi:MAG: sodium:proton antiporter [Patescibacteria group bacterium]